MREMTLWCGPSGPVTGDLGAWSSKPEMQRLIITASLAKGTSIIRNFRLSHETHLMRRACESLFGAEFRIDGSNVRITGGGPRWAQAGDIDCDGSALVARVSTALASAMGIRARITGNPVLRSRPMAPLFAVLESLGGSFDHGAAPGRLPAMVTGRARGGGSCTFRGDISSQFTTAMLMAAPLMEGGLRLEVTGETVSPSYVAMTLQAQRTAGVHVLGSPGEGSFTVTRQDYRPFEAAVGPDYTSCSYFMAAAAMSGGKVTIRGLDTPTLQGEQAIVGILREMGARVEFREGTCLVAGDGRLRGGLRLDATDYPNIIPTVAVLAAVADGTTVLTGGGVTNSHKSPRVTALVAGLRHLGVAAEVIVERGRPVGFSITGRPGLDAGARLDAREDHRLAKAFSLLALKARSPLTITGIASQRALLERFVDECCALGHNIRFAVL